MARKRRVQYYEMQRAKELSNKFKIIEDVIEDGIGNKWINKCPYCDKLGTLEVIAPGRVRCHNCGL